MRNSGGCHCLGRLCLQVFLAMAVVSVTYNVGYVSGHPHLYHSPPPPPPYVYSLPPAAVKSPPSNYHYTLPTLHLAVLARNTNEGPTFCVARDLADENKLQEALDWACGHAVDCSPLLEGQPCHEPNTVAAHASYAFNAYYHLSGRLTGTCDFRGLGNITTANPSHGACIFSDKKHIVTPTSSGSKNSKLAGAGALLVILVSLVLIK
ncbi:hypothetical protein MKW92_005920 [Papaver armeniacum]|nr:hypothetical protein MKW92_005920 [Papaver armeniacum]